RHSRTSRGTRPDRHAHPGDHRATHLIGGRTMLPVRRTNTILYCSRWMETLCFYREGLGLPVAHATDWLVELRLTDDSYISLADASRATIPSGRGAGITLSWQVDDLDRIHRHVETLGAAPGPIQEKWRARVFYC